MLRDALKDLDKPKRILVMCLRYVFGLINKRQINKEVSLKERKVVDQILSDGYFLKNCKLYTYKVLKDKRAHYQKYDITQDDARCLRSCIKYLADVDTSWPAIPISEIDSYVNTLLSNKIDVYMGKFITKKLSFLVKSYGLTHHDIKTDMIFSGINAIYKSYPRFESKLHAINIAKRAIHNAGMGLISYNTKSCRNQLYRDQDGLFQSKVRELSTIATLPIEDNKEELVTHKSIELLISSNTLLNEQGQRFIRIAAGKYDADFSQFLGMDNRDYIEQCKYSLYLRKLRKYFGLSIEETEEFFNDIKELL